MLILGLGAFGGGAGCARILSEWGADVTATDLRQRGDLPEAMEILDGRAVRLVLGGHDVSLFEEAEWVVVNPAVPESSPWLAIARDEGCNLTTEVNLAVAFGSAVPSFAITGTHGKSTTAALSAHLLTNGGLRTKLGGNLGGALLEDVADLNPTDRLVVELSSFQTERLASAHAWPRVAALTCLRSDHLDRHGTVEAYAEAKARLLDTQDQDGFVLLPATDEHAADWAARARGTVLWTTQGPLAKGLDGWMWHEDALIERRDGQEVRLAGRADLPFDEEFRLGCILTAVGGARLLGLSAESVAEGLRSFPGLAHRMQPIPAPPGLRYVDNGVATHPEPTVAALNSAGEGVILIAGGKDKGLSLDALCAATSACRRLHLFGEGGRRLADAVDDPMRVRFHAGTQAAVDAALADARPGETLLFSPSFSSYDEFRNFRDRAAVFQELCRRSLPPEQREPRHARSEA